MNLPSPTRAIEQLDPQPMLNALQTTLRLQAAGKLSHEEGGLTFSRGKNPEGKTTLMISGCLVLSTWEDIDSPLIDPLAGFKKLPARQREVLILRAKGLLMKEISAKLGISTYTVDQYQKIAFKKLQINRIELTAMLAKAGFI